MKVTVSIALLAVAALVQLAHCKPTHRMVRQADFTSKIKEYMNKIPGYGSSSGGSSSSESQSTSSATSSASETPAGSEAAASELNPSVAAKEGSESSSGFTSSFQNYIPSGFGSYPSQLPSQFNPSQYNQYPSQFPSQFNPNQYFPSGSSASSSAAESSAAAPAPAASELHPSVAAKEGESSSGFTSSFQNYIPSGFGSYPSQLPSQFNPSQYNPSQYNQYPSQFPSQFNPNQYFPSGSSASSSASESSAASPAPAASELQPSVAAKEGESSSGFTSSFQNYIPSGFGSYPSQFPSQFNPSQYNQYPSQFPSQFNPNQYFPSGSSASSSASESSAAAPAPAASELNPSVASKEGEYSSGFTSSFQNYIPSGFGSYPSYPSQLPSQFNPSQYNQYSNQLPSQFQPGQYMPSTPGGSSSAAQGSSTATP